MVGGDDNVLGGAARFAAVVAAFKGRPNVSAPDLGSPSSVFGATALKVEGKIFAMLVGGELVVKLPGERVETLVGSGAGSPFGAGGRVMREWVSIPLDGVADWRAVADEACAFVEPRR